MDGTLCFRWAQAGDFDAVRDLAAQLAQHIEAGAPPLTLAQFEAFYLGSAPRMQLRLAIRDDRIAGLVSWTLTHELYSADARVYISDLIVDHGARGHGVGAALMAEVKAWAHLNGAVKLGWEVWHRNASAKAFYAAQGAEVDAEAIPYTLILSDGVA